MFWVGLLLAGNSLVRAFPPGEYARISMKKKTHLYHDSLALFSPQVVEKSKIDGPQDLPVLGLYFFRGHLSPEEKTAFAAALAANKHGIGPEYPYAVLELGLRPDPPIGPKSVHVFNVGRCANEKSFSLTGAMLDYPDQVDQWNIKFTTLSGELKEGGVIEYDVSLEHKASRYLAEFRGSAPLLLVSHSRFQGEPATP